jgi:hypothetical protein
MNRTYELPPDLEELIETELQEMGFSLDNPRKLAACVQDLSDYYLQHPDGKTPWHEVWAKVAQLCYYFPLNAMRAWSVVDEGHREEFFEGLHSLVDFGSGLGAGSWWLSEIDHQVFIESSKEAQGIHKTMLPDPTYKSWHNEAPKQIPPKALGVFSYSLTETTKSPAWMYDFEALMIVEPSTRQDGRRLMELRNTLQAKGFHIWAPCTHQGQCPLLRESQTDWCHDRIHFKAPPWFLKMEALLPFKNQTLTMSYLLARKTPPPATRQVGLARMTGDRLDEKGKTRQLVCRGAEREFLTWMHKDTDPQTIPRGATIEFPSRFEKKSNEVRVNQVIKVLT